MNMDDINPVKMTISLTAKIRIKWHDNRLVFLNLGNGRNNFLPPVYTTRIWNPFQDWVIENSVFKDFQVDLRVPIKVIPQIGNDFNIIHANERFEYNGSNNLLVIEETVQLTYKCKFDLRRFPFDQQICPLGFKMYHRPTTTFKFQSPAPVLYNGSRFLDQFDLEKMDSGLSQTERYTTYTVKISFRRVPSMQLQKTFFPIFLMGILGYSTLFC